MKGSHHSTLAQNQSHSLTHIMVWQRLNVATVTYQSDYDLTALVAVTTIVRFDHYSRCDRSATGTRTCMHWPQLKPRDLGDHGLKKREFCKRNVRQDRDVWQQARFNGVMLSVLTCIARADHSNSRRWIKGEIIGTMETQLFPNCNGKKIRE